MNAKASRKARPSVGTKLSAVGTGGLVLGVILMLAGLAFLVWQAVSSADSEIGRSIAEQDAAAMAAAIADIERELHHVSVVAAARRVPEDRPEQTAPVAEALAERGLTDLIDVRVFPPRVEEIEVGAYPDPDFAVVQMLVEARRQGTANVRVRHEGTADEHLAFATAVYDEADEVEALMLARVPVERVIGQMTSPGREAWTRLVQGSRVVRRLPTDTPADAAAVGRRVVDGAAFALEWGMPPARGGLSPAQSMLLLVVGLIIAIIGVLVRSGKIGRVPKRAAPGRSPASQPAASPPVDRPVPATPSVPPAAEAEPGPAPAPPESTEPKPDLPDWLLDEGSGPQGLPFGDSDESAGRKQAETSKPDSPDEEADAADELSAREPPLEPSDGGLELEVPDLDEILAQIDDSSETGAAPESRAREEGGSDERDSGVPDFGEGLDFHLDSADAGSETDETPAESSGEEELTLSDLDLAGEEESEPDRTDLDYPEAELPGEAPDEDGGLSLALEPDASDSSPEDPDDELLDLDTPAATAATETHPRDEADVESADEEPDEEARLLAAVENSDLFSPALFHVDGIRGVVDQTLDAHRATELGRAIGTMAVGQGHNKVAVGRDGRVSGPLLMSAVIRGLRNAGMDVIEAGSVPAPALWFAASEMADGCGVMVSGSHHGPDENGLQVMLGGHMLGRRQMLEVAGIAINGQFVEGEGGYVQEGAARPYAEALADAVKLERRLKVVVDCGNGIAGNIVPLLFEAWQIDLIPLYCDVDGSFPNHRPDPSDPECLEDLRLCVRNFRADLGLAFDGDGDRLALVANDSEVVNADRILMLLARDMLAREPGATVVMDVRSSARLVQVVEEAGGRAVLVPAGGVSVARAIVAEDAALGGDMDGQIIVARRWYPFGDAICAAGRLLELFTGERRSVRECLDELPDFRTTGALPVAIDARSGHRLIQRLQADTDFGDAQVTTVDGIRVDFTDRWGLLRVSADDGAVELRFGGDDPASLNQIKADFRSWLLSVDPDLPLPY